MIDRITYFFYKLKRAISWGIFMFNNGWYDYSFMQSFMDKKLKEMEIWYRTHAYIGSRYSYARLIRLARKYLELSNENYWDKRRDEYFQKRFDEKYGRIKLLLEPIQDKSYSKCIFKYGGINDERAAQVSYRYTRRSEYLQRKYYDKFWDVMKKHIGWMCD